MRRIIVSLASLAALGLLAGPATAQDDEAEKTRGEKQLERLLGDRVAGEPERCVRMFRHTRVTVVDGEGLVVRAGGKVYLNRTRDPEFLDDDDILVFRRYAGGTLLCARDTIETYSRGGEFMTGIISLGEFVPYTRAEG